MISINRALSELKLLNKKIEDKTDKLEVAIGTQKINETDKEAFLAKADADIQQVRGLIARRNLIKSAVVLSNANTSIVVAGQLMTVAEAIERKQSIDLDKSLNRRMRERYFGIKAGVEQHNDNVKVQADEQAKAALGADTEADKGAGYKSIVEAYVDRNKAELIAPQDIELQIESDQDKIDEFEAEIDFILSESNTKTEIDV